MKKISCIFLIVSCVFSIVAHDDEQAVDRINQDYRIESLDEESEETRAIKPNIGGLLDPTFGTNGVVTIRFTQFNTVVNPLPIVGLNFYSDYFFSTVLGTVDVQRRAILIVSNQGMFAIIRLLEDGTLDQTFGGTGQVLTYIPRSQEEYPVGFGDPNYAFASSQSVVIDQQGNIVVGGFVVHDNKNTANLLVARYLPNGQLDKSFGLNGLSEIQSSIGVSNFINQVICDTQNRIILVGAQVTQPNFSPVIRKFLAIRLLPNGSLDPSFGDNGIFLYQVTTLSNALLRSVIVDAYGNCLMAGVVQTLYQDGSGSAESVLIKLLENGSFDETFGKNGILKTPVTPLPGFQIDTIGSFKLMLDAFQNVVVSGSGSDLLFGNPGKINFPLLLRYLQTTYALDKDFGKAGRVGIKSFNSFGGYANDIDIDLLGRILVGASYTTGPLAAYRLLPSGVLDTTFGQAHNGSAIITPILGTRLRPPFIKVDGSGRLYVFSFLVNFFAFPQKAYFYIARYTSDYSLIFSGTQ
jgi:uncharacterized delta-60 repeat protein